MKYDRIKVPRAEVLKEMGKIDPKDAVAVKKFSLSNDSVAAPEFDYYGEKVNPLTPRQYVVALVSFDKSAKKNFEESWWEMVDFVEAGKEENMSHVEMQLLCMMLEMWLNMNEIEYY